MYTSAMAKRLQTINGDTVLEMTETRTMTVRLSQKALQRRKAYLEGAITKFETELADTNAKLATIHEERSKSGR